MTVDYKIDAMLELRKYIWTKLQAAGVFDPEEYYSDNLQETVVPIFPIQQQPEMNQYFSGKKHIVYDKVGISYDTLWLICNEQIVFTIYSTDVSEINEIRNFMIDEFRRMDESARDVNLSAGFNSAKFKIHSIYVADMSPIEPSKELEGFLSADVILEMKYSRNTNSSGRFV